MEIKLNDNLIKILDLLATQAGSSSAEYAEKIITEHLSTHYRQTVMRKKQLEIIELAKTIDTDILSDDDEIKTRVSQDIDNNL